MRAGNAIVVGAAASSSPAVAAVSGGEATPSAHAIQARVVRVVDGDTIVASVEGADQYVRYIGIDTPETVKPGTPVQCYGPQASEENHRLVDGRTVRLVFDRERRDDYGRLLAYVYTDAGHGREVARGSSMRRSSATATRARSRSRRTPPTPHSWAASLRAPGRPAGACGASASAATNGRGKGALAQFPSLRGGNSPSRRP